MSPRFAEQVLDLVNTVRMVRGRQPLRAIHLEDAVPRDSEFCLLACAMDCTVEWYDPPARRFDPPEQKPGYEAAEGTSGWVMEFETNAEACLVSEALGEPCPWPGLVALPTALQWVLWAFDVEALEPMDLHVSRVDPAQLSLDDDAVVQAEQVLAETRGSRDPDWFSEPACTTTDVA